jgi:hypothetical protein
MKIGLQEKKASWAASNLRSGCRCRFRSHFRPAPTVADDQQRLTTVLYSHFLSRRSGQCYACMHLVVHHLVLPLRWMCCGRSFYTIQPRERGWNVAVGIWASRRAVCAGRRAEITWTGPPISLRMLGIDNTSTPTTSATHSQQALLLHFAPYTS